MIVVCIVVRRCLFGVVLFVFYCEQTLWILGITMEELPPPSPQKGNATLPGKKVKLTRLGMGTHPTDVFIRTLRSYPIGVSYT
jgi:hypothetical protein